MNKIAFVVPTYPPHYNMSFSLYNSFLKYKLNEQADWYFVFTNGEEESSFPCGGNHLVLPKDWNLPPRGIIIIKKFYALSCIKDKYDYVWILDTDSLIVKNINLLRLCETYFSKKILLGNKTVADLSNIKNSCMRFFDKSQHKYLKSDLYLWFNNSCIYSCSSINNFFDIINYQENYDKFQWDDFEYYIYMYYLILYHGFKIYDIGIIALYGALEDSSRSLIFENESYQKRDIYMSSKVTFNIFDNPDLFVICHTDRIKQQPY